MKTPLLLLALFLTACQTPPERSIASPYYDVPLGSRLVLNQPIEIPAASATVRLQFGKIVSRFHTQDFEPVCVFESRVVGEAAQIIVPDSFEIVSVRRGYGTLSAQVEPRAKFIRVEGDGGRQYYKTELFLRSAKQPQILTMTCQHGRESGRTLFELVPVTIAEMRQAMGAYFTLHLAGVDI